MSVPHKLNASVVQPGTQWRRLNRSFDILMSFFFSFLFRMLIESPPIGSPSFQKTSQRGSCTVIFLLSPTRKPKLPLSPPLLLSLSLFHTLCYTLSLSIPLCISLVRARIIQIDQYCWRLVFAI